MHQDCMRSARSACSRGGAAGPTRRGAPGGRESRPQAGLECTGAGPRAACGRPSIPTIDEPGSWRDRVAVRELFDRARLGQSVYGDGTRRVQPGRTPRGPAALWRRHSMRALRALPRPPALGC